MGAIEFCSSLRLTLVEAPRTHLSPGQAILSRNDR